MKMRLIIALFALLGLLAGCSPKKAPCSPTTSAAEASAPAAPVIPYSPPALLYTPSPPLGYGCKESDSGSSEATPLITGRLPFPKKEQPLIAIDAGHGGEDFGTQSLGKPKYQEKHLNMSTAQMVKKFLEQFGYKVVMTRNDDSFISLEKRASFANQQKPKLFVSIHYNSAPSKEAEGVEVYYYNGDANKPRAIQSKLLARALLDKVIGNTQAKSRGVKHGNFAVIRDTNMPAVLIEGGFLTNADEMEKLKSAAYLKSIALGIAQGVHEYVIKDRLLADRQ